MTMWETELLWKWMCDFIDGNRKRVSEHEVEFAWQQSARHIH